MEDSFLKLYNLLVKLRAPGGCEWDRAQTLHTIKDKLLEEADEVAEAIDNEDYDNLREELGDLMFNVLIIALIAEENDLFDIKKVFDEAAEKLIRRHPHVFADAKAETPEEVHKMWVKIKEEEKKMKNKLKEAKNKKNEEKNKKKEEKKMKNNKKETK